MCGMYLTLTRSEYVSGVIAAVDVGDFLFITPSPYPELIDVLIIVYGSRKQFSADSHSIGMTSEYLAERCLSYPPITTLEKNYEFELPFQV